MKRITSTPAGPPRSSLRKRRAGSTARFCAGKVGRPGRRAATVRICLVRRALDIRQSPFPQKSQRGAVKSLVLLDVTNVAALFKDDQLSIAVRTGKFFGGFDEDVVFLPHHHQAGRFQCPLEEVGRSRLVC